MIERNYSIKRNRFLIPFLLSIIFHILLLIVYILWGGNYFLADIKKNKNKQVVLEFAKPENRRREVVETPKDAKRNKSPDKADLASDKNAAARDLNREKKDIGDIPFSKGISDVKDIVKNRGENGRPVKQGNAKQKKQLSAPRDEYAEKIKTMMPASEFNKNVLLGKKSVSPGQRDYSAPYKQTKSSADDVGGISFNTYNWNFAPYLIELKKRIQRNIYPPPAFTRLGFGGANILKFRIYPDGRLEGPLVLHHQGEEALIETSRKAVEMSAPFLPLPDDFPEKYLEVTANFKYYIMNY
ncbi:hypothetical protein J7K93_00855 [bacterium]|nr:hypothetical protein [bacterium]